MSTIATRRSFLIGIGSALAAPAIVRASSLMPVRAIPWCSPVYDGTHSNNPPWTAFTPEQILADLDALIKSIAKATQIPGYLLFGEQPAPPEYHRRVLHPFNNEWALEFTSQPQYVKPSDPGNWKTHDKATQQADEPAGRKGDANRARARTSHGNVGAGPQRGDDQDRQAAADQDQEAPARPARARERGDQGRRLGDPRDQRPDGRQGRAGCEGRGRRSADRPRTYGQGRRRGEA